MILFRYLLYLYLLFNLAHLLQDCYFIIRGNDYLIAQNKKRLAIDYVWYELEMNTQNEDKYSIITTAQLLTKQDSLGYYFNKVKSNAKLYVGYSQNKLSIPLSKNQLSTLWFKSQLGLILYRLALVVITILMILFLRCIQMGKMFSKKSLILLQVIGVMVLIGGLLDYAGILILLPTLENICGIETYGMIPKNSIIITTPFLAVVGYFILAIAFCFGKACFLEKENALTI